VIAVKPAPGLVISYRFLWHEQRKRGQEEGHKERPCLILGTEREADGSLLIVVLPITHAPPVDPELAKEVPAAVRKHLQLDDERCWIVLGEANIFYWPGMDLCRSAPGDSLVYERVPPRLFEKVRREYLALARAGRARAVKRTG